MTAPGEDPSRTDAWGKTPAWILDPDLYLPAYYATIPEDQRKKGDDKPLTASELRVYIAMRTFADRGGKCMARNQTIAERAKVDKSSAERAISKFRRLGWLTSKRHYRDDKSISRCDYFLRDACPTPEDIPHPEDDGGVPVGSRVGYPRDDGKGTRGLTGAKNTPDEHTKRTDEGSEVECLPSGRFAPFGPGDEDKDSQPLILVAPTTKTKGFTDWRSEDYELFLMHLGSDEVINHGGPAGPPGTHPARSLYEGMQRQMPGGPKPWPGKYLKGIAERDPDNGVRGWLAKYDLEPGD